MDLLGVRSLRLQVPDAKRLTPWVQASLEQRKWFQQLFFPDGISFDGNGFVRTAVTAPAFSYLRPIEGRNEGVVDQTGASWNRIGHWLRQIDELHGAA